MKHDGFVKRPDAAFKLHPFPAFAGTGLLRRTPKYAAFLRLRTPCLRPFYEVVK